MSNYGGYAAPTANSAEPDKSKFSGKRTGWFPPFAVRFCPEYIKNPAGAPCKISCTKLHVCRKWVAGCCGDKTCEHAHSLLEASNVRVLRAAGIQISPNGCHDKVRRLLSCLFPHICVPYNQDNGCPNEQCSHLHLCRMLVLEGYCLQSSYKKCPFNHAVSHEQLRPIWLKFGVTWSSQREIQALYWDLLPSDSLKFEPACQCKECIMRMQNTGVRWNSRSKGSQNDEPDDQSADGSSANNSDDENTSVQELMGVRKPVLIDSFDKLNLRDALRRGVAAPKGNDPVSQTAALIACLLEGCLVMPAEQVALHFNMNASQVPGFVESLRQAKVFEPAFRSQLPKAFEWNKIHFVGMLNVVRVCVEQYAVGGCQSPRCPYLHLCKNFVTDVCTSKSCQYSHDLLNQPLFSRLGCDSFSAEKRLALIRVSHPTVCAVYAYDAAGCRDGSCVNIHVCNEFILGCQCKPNCLATKDHNPTSNGNNSRNLLRFGLASTKKETVALLVLPVVPPRFAVSTNGVALRPVETSEGVPATGSTQTSASRINMDSVAASLPQKASRPAVSPVDATMQKASSSAAQTSQPGVQVGSLAICEPQLRGMCSAKGHEAAIHHSQPFCWVYKLPRAEEALAYMKRMLPNARKYKTQDGSTWVAFVDKDSLIMEEGFSSPQVRLLNRTVELGEQYPFAGDSEIVFGSVREEASFRMTTRLKQLVPAVGQKVAGANSAKDTDEPIVRLSKQIEMEVRCFRTPSYAASPANHLKATHWRWFYKHRDPKSGEETWRDCQQLVGDNHAEIEHAYVSATASVSLPDKEYCRPGGAVDARKHYTFDFETMLVFCDDDDLQADLCARPALSQSMSS